MPYSAPALAEFHSAPYKLPLEYALDFNLEKNPDHVAIVHPTVDGFRNYTYRELVPAAHRMGHFLSKSLGAPSAGSVVAVLMKTDTMTYFLTLLGLLRAGLTPFPISVRFSDEVVTHLLCKATPVAILVNDHTKELATQAVNLLAKTHNTLPQLCFIPPVMEFFPGHNDFTALPVHERQTEDISLLLHSSSSSSIFPKIIPWSSITLTHHGEIKDVPLRNVAGTVFGGFGLELFHAWGLCVFSAIIRRGLIVGLMNPSEPASVLPADMNDLYNCFTLMRPSMLICNPRNLELWAEDQDKVAQLRDAGVDIMIGGRFLNKEIGDKLARNGVRICTIYGSTETGAMTLFPHDKGVEWDYFTIHPSSPEIQFVPRHDGLLEVFVTPLDNEMNYLPFTNAILNGKPAYNPGDLFTRHPTRPNTYKMFGRSSDQIMLATGETINPIEIESKVLRNPHVCAAVMFGHTRFKVGMVVEAVQDPIISHGEGPNADCILDKIWPDIQSINAQLPPYARLAKEMIIIAGPSKPIQMNLKHLPRRPVVWQQYQTEIDALYLKDLMMVPK